MPLTARIAELVQPSLTLLGVDLVDVEMAGRSPRQIVRLTIDRPGGVTLGDCERVSTAVGTVLDTYDTIAGRYTLEVSSPGAERPVRTADEWQAALGRRLNVRLRSGEGEVVVEGRLLALDESTMEIEVRDGKRRRPVVFPRDAVLAARIVVDI